MEATPTTKPACDWLAIELTCARTGKQICFSITFRNVSEQPQQLPFSNRARKAEYWGLRVAEEGGQPIKPERTMLVHPRVPDPDLHPLARGEAWTYDLVGEVTEAGLVFPASVFRLRLGTAYTARFAYKGVASNKVRLVL